MGGTTGGGWCPGMPPSLEHQGGLPGGDGFTCHLCPGHTQLFARSGCPRMPPGGTAGKVTPPPPPLDPDGSGNRIGTHTKALCSGITSQANKELIEGSPLLSPKLLSVHLPVQGALDSERGGPRRDDAATPRSPAELQTRASGVPDSGVAWERWAS